MSRRTGVPAGAAAGGQDRATDAAPDRFATAARKLHRDALIIDLHADTPSDVLRRPRYDFGRRHRSGHLDLPRLREAGVDGQFLIAFVPENLAGRPGASFAHAVRLIEAVHETAARTSGLRLATSAEAVEAAAAAGEVAALIGVEGGHAIEASLDRLRELFGMGARYMTLTWNNGNEWADACCSPPRHAGLTPFGREVVEEMNRLGMIVDVSHVADTTFWHVMETSSAPVIASHSNARALADHPRNLTDDQLRALAASGGVVGINFFAAFLDATVYPALEAVRVRTDALERRLRRRHHPRRAARLARRWRDRRLARIRKVPVDAVADHVFHIADAVGPEHVALGSDFDGILVTPAGLEDVTGLPRLTEALLRRGMDEDAARGILGANFLRVFRAVARAASPA